MGEVLRAARRGLIGLAVLPVSFVIGGYLAGILGIALAWVVTFPLCHAWPLRVLLKELELRFSEYLGAFARATESVLAMLVAVSGTRLIMGEGLPAWLRLGAAILAGAVGYLSYALLRHGATLRRLVANFRAAR